MKNVMKLYNRTTMLINNITNPVSLPIILGALSVALESILGTPLRESANISFVALQTAVPI